MLYGVSQIINNRLVALIAFNEGLDPISLHELTGELECIAAIRLSPHGRRMKARTLYRLLAIKHFRGSVSGRASVRVNLWAEFHTRNGRSIVEIDRLAMDFHRQAAVLLSRGESPVHLLDALHRDDLQDRRSHDAAGDTETVDCHDKPSTSKRDGPSRIYSSTKNASN
ncbi:MAG: hypothetical protein DCC69_10090 [Hyphomicrobiales bacterium]|nr:MAG: hypothetical protein DCC69_10090 [Hyphomicrobiales bacterium]